MLGSVTGSNEEKNESQEKEAVDETNYQPLTEEEKEEMRKKFKKGLEEYLNNFNESLENRLVSPQEKLDKRIESFMRRIIKKDPENKIKDAIIEKINKKMDDPKFKIEKKED